MTFKKIAWNKGLTKETDERVRKLSECAKGRHPSEETRIKISENQKGKIISEETRKKLSEKSKGRHHSKETKIKMSKSKKGKKFSKEHKEKLSESHKNKHPSNITKKKMSESAKGRMPSPKSGRGKHFCYQSSLQNKIWLKSSWELAFVKWLEKHNILYLYEISTFDLGDTTYTPDFYLPTSNLFIEIKGFMRKKSQEKINKFLDNYYEETLLILYKEDLIELGIKL